MELTDEELVQLFLDNGDNRAFDLLIQRHHAKTLSRCLGYVKNKTVAEDICQDVFTKIYEKLKTFRKEARFTTWLYSIVHNECLEYLRKNKKRVHEILTEKLADELIEEIDEHDVDKELTEESLMILLEEMTTEDKLILLLKYKEKRPIKEIQEVMHLNESAVKMRLKRARERINRLYFMRK